MTLTDREYQHLRDLAIGIIREVGVDTGGCNIQFAVNPADGRVIVIEMNPVSRPRRWRRRPPASRSPRSRPRSRSATLDEIPNDITTAETPAFEPTLDYVVVKVPPVRVREVPGRRPGLTTHEVGGRGDGHRPQLHRGRSEGAALAGEQGGGLPLGPGDPGDRARS